MFRTQRIVRAVLALCCCSTTAPAQAVLFESSGTQVEETYGWEVAGLGDVNADGKTDYALGVLGDATHGSMTGRLEVRSGLDGSLLLVRIGQGANVWYGTSICDIGDLDGDARADIAVGAPGYGVPSIQPGYVELVSGVSGALLRRYDGASGGQYGSALANVGDVDGDGVADLLIGQQDNSRAELRSGASGALIREFLGPAGSYFGCSLTSLGDVDHDAQADFAFGAYHENGPGGTWAGSVSVFSGATGAVLFVHRGVLPYDFVGYKVARIGDVDGDGSDDLVTGGRANGSFAGRGLVLSGLTGARLRQTDGMVPGDQLGFHVASLGDWDGDGAADYALSGIRSGQACAVNGHVDVHSALTGELLMSIAGRSVNADFGFGVAGLGDLDVDGIPEWVVSAPRDDEVVMNAGRVRVLTGRPVQPVSFFCFGDGSGAACPCGNGSVPGFGQGCSNSELRGARLLSHGVAQIGADSLMLQAAYLPANTSVLFFQGTLPVGAGAGTAFGDGLRCVAGSTTRLGTMLTGCGQASFPESGPDLSVLGGAVAGQTLHYQAWYRNLAGPCGGGFNLSNALSVTWLP